MMSMTMMMCDFRCWHFCSTREKIVKFLQSNPVQILLCVIVLLDAGVVIAQILLDLNSVKGIVRTRWSEWKRRPRPTSNFVHLFSQKKGAEDDSFPEQL